MKSRETLVREVVSSMKEAAIEHHKDPDTPHMNQHAMINRRMRWQARAAVNIILGPEEGE